jgi:hypothetical protein
MGDKIRITLPYKALLSPTTAGELSPTSDHAGDNTGRERRYANQRPCCPSPGPIRSACIRAVAGASGFTQSCGISVYSDLVHGSLAYGLASSGFGNASAGARNAAAALHRSNQVWESRTTAGKITTCLWLVSDRDST